VVTTSDDDRHMARALFHAARGIGRTAPNPMVGAVLVSPEGVVVGTGYHEAAGRPHAEVVAIEAAGSAAREATLYCTLEPCCHWGRTGPCVERIVAAGVTRVVAAIEDPDPRVSGGGFRYLRERGVAVEVGLRRREATRLNGPFLTARHAGRPFVTLKIALSRDGLIAGRPGERTPMTGPAAQRLAHLERAWVDAIAIGARTLLVDDPLLTARGAYRPRPLTRVVFDAHFCTPPTARLLSTLDAGPVIIVVTKASASAEPARARAVEAAGATVLALDDRDLARALGQLAALGVQSLLIEGGCGLHRAAWRAGVVDRVEVFMTPHAIGPDGVAWLSPAEVSLAALQELRVEPCGSDVRIEGYVHRVD
jgi:diaminohydroxyphosphoribosylaminopyrimidine deaminase/5-amino-6-(5-phosphoribosylamino)uracil reductase